MHSADAQSGAFHCFGDISRFVLIIMSTKETFQHLPACKDHLSYIGLPHSHCHSVSSVPCEDGLSLQNHLKTETGVAISKSYWLVTNTLV